MAGENGLPTEQDFVPPAVRRASEAANAIHAQAYQQQPEPQQPQQPEPQQPQQPEPQQPAPPPAGESLDPAPTADIQSNEYAARYNSMRGRFMQSQQANGQLQEMLAEMGDELIRTQQALALARQRGGAPDPQDPQQPQRPAQSRAITEADRKTYGDELIEFITRAARDAVQPDLRQVSTQIQQTNQRVARTAVQGVHEALDSAVPNWRQINVDPDFIAWCGLRDVYSGMVRGQMLKAAFQAAEAPRVIAFFKGYLEERKATGHDDPGTQQQTTQQQQPRQAAVPLETLTAPGRAKPATGETPSAAEKPVFTRAQIAQFYSDVRKQVYAGRDEEKNRIEQAIFAAQREGRVR